MGVKFIEKKGEKITYELIPEEIPLKTKDNLLEYKKINSEVDGYSKKRTLRHIGRVPYSFMYNYCLHNEIPIHKMHEYFTEKKGKNLRLLLNEFNCFKMVDKL